jgi:hypothetical protein
MTHVRVAFVFTAAVLAGLASERALAQSGDRGQAQATVGGKPVTIDYGRPALAGRDMIGKAPVGRPWRMGKDAETTLKTDADLKFGELAVPKGEYVLTATKVAEGQWELNFIKTQPFKTPLGSVPLKSDAVKDSVETFTIELTGSGSAGTLTLKWGTSALSTPFSAS